MVAASKLATVFCRPSQPVIRFAGSVVLLFVLAGCASLPQNIDREPSFALQDTAGTQLGESLRQDLAANPQQSGFYLLDSGLDAYAARAILAMTAERSIDAQYYLWHNDMVGNLLFDALLKAADRGVRVRLLVDDMTLDDDKDIGVAAIDAHPLVEVRVFNPFVRNSQRWLQFASRFDEVSRRMHNKSFTVDNQFSIVGGRNIGNEYFEADPDLVFGDLDVLSVGPVVADVSSSFDLYWNSERSYPISTLLNRESDPDDVAKLRSALADHLEQHRDSAYTQALLASNLVERVKNHRLEFEWGEGRVVVDDPTKVTATRDQTQLHMSAQLGGYFDEISRELIIFSPYFVPGREGVAYFQKLRERGVRVRILTNSLASTDVAAVHAGYSKYRKYLLRAGVELYEADNALTAKQRSAKKKNLGGSSKASLHAKSFVIDRQRLFIGSLNFDPRSVVENTEIGVMIESPDIAISMSDWFDQNIDQIAFRLALETSADSSEMLIWYRDTDAGIARYIKEPDTSFWRRFGVGFLRLLPIESLL